MAHEGSATPEEAARGDIPERYARALCVAISPDGDEAIVVLDTIEEPYLYTRWDVPEDFRDTIGVPRAVRQLRDDGTEEPIEPHPFFERAWEWRHAPRKGDCRNGSGRRF
jgi:hypothetical protein